MKNQVEAFATYDAATAQTWRGTPDGLPELVYLVLAINGEAGEMAEKVKKIYRDQGGQVSVRDVFGLLLEAGDVLYYLSRLAQAAGSSLGVVAEMNISKLHSRAERGTLSGSGDQR